MSSSLVLLHDICLVEQGTTAQSVSVLGALYTVEYVDMGILMPGKLHLGSSPYMERLRLLYPGGSSRHSNVTSTLLTRTGWT